MQPWTWKSNDDLHPTNYHCPKYVWVLAKTSVIWTKACHELAYTQVAHEQGLLITRISSGLPFSWSGYMQAFLRPPIFRTNISSRVKQQYCRSGLRSHKGIITLGPDQNRKGNPAHRYLVCSCNRHLTIFYPNMFKPCTLGSIINDIVDLGQHVE